MRADAADDFFAFEFQDPVAQLCCFFETQLLGHVFHLGFEQLDLCGGFQRLAGDAGGLFFQPALADYLGKPVIDWVARWLVIPGGIISLVIAGFCAIWRPDYMMRGIYSFIVCIALLFVIKSADFLVNLLQQELG